jgi:hypothetical protein
MGIKQLLNKTLTLKRRTQVLSGGIATKTYSTITTELSGRIYQESGERDFSSGVAVDVNSYTLDTTSSEVKVGDVVVDGSQRYEVASRYGIQSKKNIHHYKYTIKLTQTGE